MGIRGMSWTVGRPPGVGDHSTDCLHPAEVGVRLLLRGEVVARRSCLGSSAMDDTAGARRGAVRDRIFDGGLVALAALAGFWPAVYWWEAPQTLPIGMHLDYV